ncbi:enolase C-terminal domain-like protein [Estrella lausannensis]|uniref:Mandelate racemase/muconate lactonizing enzyme C-terminal domain-containing protein n=1 Tax=Estrella lausannensis TaxID=483423 RepID=A0A0H5E4J9_9BACT|nr:enolase C-terminal domain-like protein [Estrella lausannensis]CRX38140.1 hypothetical protein ELAC_0788 [Estrella lausannensis]
MFKILAHPYSLRLKNIRSSRLLNHKREGALLRFSFPDGSSGYSDLHPWEEFGDLSLDQEIELLKSGRPTALGFRALQLAAKDAEFRRQGVNALEGLTVPKSHFLLSGDEHKDHKLLETIANSGFDTLKIKAGSALDFLDELVGALKHHPFKIRIDFNERLDAGSLPDALNRLKPLEEKIDFLEDPTRFDREMWIKAMERSRIPFAKDMRLEEAFSDKSIPILVMKPAKQNEEMFLQEMHPEQKVVVTSYLGHPLGQVQAAYVAGVMQKSIPLETAGLKSHHQYETDAFSERLGPLSPHFQAPAGTGWGFDDLLPKLSWS